MYNYNNHINKIGYFYNGIPNSSHLMNGTPEMEIQFCTRWWAPFIISSNDTNTTQTQIYGPLYLLLLEVAMKLNAS